MHVTHHCDVMLFGTLLLLTLLSGTAAQDCTKKIQRCMNIYMDNVALHPNNAALICQDTNIFIKCASDECGLSESQTVEITAAAQRDLASKGLQCVVNINNLTTLRPQTMNPRTVEPTTCNAAISSCTRSYLNDVMDHANRDIGGQQICHLTEKYVTCLMNSPCEAQLIKSNIKDNIESELKKKNIHCNLNIGEKLLTVRPKTKNSDTTGHRSLVAHSEFVAATSVPEGNGATTQRHLTLAASLTTLSTLVMASMIRNGYI